MWVEWQTDAFVLVQQWKTGQAAGLISAAVCACLCGVIYEFISYAKHYRNQKKMNTFCNRLLAAVLHATHLVCGYVIMFFLMTYNAWVILATLLGSALGFFVIGPSIKKLRMRSRTPVILEPKSKLSADVAAPSYQVNQSKPDSSVKNYVTGSGVPSERCLHEQRQALLMEDEGCRLPPDDINVVLGFTSAVTKANLA